jgi:hypothetical protein
VDGSGEEPIVRLPGEQGVGAQQLPVLPDGQHGVVPQQLTVQQLVVQQLVVQQLVVQHGVLVQQAVGLDTGQQAGCAAELLGGALVGTGQHGMTSDRSSGHAIRGDRDAPAAAPGAATTHAAAVAASRSESETRRRRIAGPGGRVGTVTA